MELEAPRRAAYKASAASYWPLASARGELAASARRATALAAFGFWKESARAACARFERRSLSATAESAWLGARDERARLGAEIARARERNARGSALSARLEAALAQFERRELRLAARHTEPLCAVGACHRERGIELLRLGQTDRERPDAPASMPAALSTAVRAASESININPPTPCQ